MPVAIAGLPDDGLRLLFDEYPVGANLDPPTLGRSLYIADFDSSGAAAGAYPLSLIGSIGPRAFATFTDGSYAIGGQLLGTVELGGEELSAVSTDESTASDAFIAGFTVDGAHRFSLRAGSIGWDAVSALTRLDDDTLVGCGTFSTAIDFGSGPLVAPPNGYVVWIRP